MRRQPDAEARRVGRQKGSKACGAPRLPAKHSGTSKEATQGKTRARIQVRSGRGYVRAQHRAQPGRRAQASKVPPSAATIISTPTQILARNSMKLRSGRFRLNSSICQRKCAAMTAITR